MKKFFEINGMRILVVDDVTTNREVLERMLEEEGYEIAQADSGELAVELANKIKPDAILLDVLMPNGMDGFEVCKKIRENTDLDSTPIIFITALGEAEDVVQGFRCGGADYITKPFQIEEVRARVRTHLMLKKATDELAKARISS
jgi:DNA-binding response OmpR family regulator